MAESADSVVKRNESQCLATIDAFRKELLRIKTGRASVGLLDGICAEYYGARTPIAHLGQINTPDARTISIQLYDVSAGPHVEKAIGSAGLGFNPIREGNVVRVIIPALTEETRKDIVRKLHKLAEDVRVSIRNHRRVSNEDVKKAEKNGDISKDDTKKLLDQVQKMTDSYIQKVDQMLSAKEKECMEV